MDTVDLSVFIRIYLRGIWMGTGFMRWVVGLWVKKKGQTGSLLGLRYVYEMRGSLVRGHMCTDN